MFLKPTLFLAALSALAEAVPATILERADTCGQWDNQVAGDYTVYNDLWGEGSATSGSGCYGVDSVSGNKIAWHATWTWVGGQYNVKSFPNAVLNTTPKTLSAIKSMKSQWKWTYTGSNLVADVAYDMFTSSTASGSNEYEIMIWLAALGGAGPISSSYGADGKPVPIASVTLAGHGFKLYKGPNGSTTVFSFIPDSQVNSFNGDIKTFLSYLSKSQGLPSSQYLTSIGAGTEPTTGTNATFKVSDYCLAIA